MAAWPDKEKMIEVQARLAQADAQGIEIAPAPLVQMAAQGSVPGSASSPTKALNLPGTSTSAPTMGPLSVGGADAVDVSLPAGRGEPGTS